MISHGACMATVFLGSEVVDHTVSSSVFHTHKDLWKIPFVITSEEAIIRWILISCSHLHSETAFAPWAFLHLEAPILFSFPRGKDRARVES